MSWRMTCPKCGSANVDLEEDQRAFLGGGRHQVQLHCYTCGKIIYGEKPIQDEANRQRELWEKAQAAKDPALEERRRPVDESRRPGLDVARKLDARRAVQDGAAARRPAATAAPVPTGRAAPARTANAAAAAPAALASAVPGPAQTPPPVAPVALTAPPTAVAVAPVVQAPVVVAPSAPVASAPLAPSREAEPTAATPLTATPPEAEDAAPLPPGDDERSVDEARAEVDPEAGGLSEDLSLQPFASQGGSLDNDGEEPMDEETARRVSLGLCAWMDCEKQARPNSKYCSRNCSNKNARARHSKRRKPDGTEAEAR